ncbi:MAG: hypothetical protein SFT92_08885 [Rickettsiales bacterium]|nr:hypothetical protein [Rickettsiales bacterium]
MLKIMCLALSDPQWPRRLKRLCHEYNAEVIYWSGMRKRINNVKRNFPNVLFQFSAHATKGIPPRELRKTGFKLLPLDTDILDAMAPHQITAMKLMDRMDADLRTFTFEERLRFYYRQVRFWYSLLLHMKPDLVFFPITPHDNYDYIAYALCQHLNIETVMLDRTALPSRVLYGRTISDPSDKLQAAYRQRLLTYKDGDEVTLSPYVKSYYERMQGDYSQALPPNVRKKMEKRGLKNYSSTSESWRHFLRYEYLEFRGQLKRRVGIQRVDSYMKEKFRAPERSNVNFIEEVRHRVHGKRIKNSLKKYYLTYQRVPDLNKPYIYVALHYQPERNSVPLGGWFGEQLLMVSILSAALPDGWKLYVKEHGQQWSYFSKGERGRTIALYKDIRKLRNTILVPAETPSFELIDKSRMTATIAGSVGWESIMRGKAALIFGEAWYKGCDGVWCVNNLESAKQAIAAINNGATVDRNKVKLFLDTLDKNSIHTLIDTIREDAGELNEIKITENFVHGIGSYLVKTFPDKARYWAENAQPGAGKRVAMLCTSETVLQEFVGLAEKFLEEQKMFPVLVMPQKFFESPHFRNANVSLEAVTLPKGDPVEIIKLVLKNRMFPFGWIAGLFLWPAFLLMLVYKKTMRLTLINLYKKIPKRIRDHITLKEELELLAIKAEGLMKAECISALIVPDDRVASYAVTWLSTARKLGIPTSMVSFAISHPEGSAFMRRERINEHHLDQGKNQRFKREFAKKYPGHLTTTQYGTMLFYTPLVAKTLEKLNMLPEHPWVSGGGDTDKVYVISEYDKQVMRDLGITKPIDAVGQCVMDKLWDANVAKVKTEAEIRTKYKLHASKPILVFAVPHMAEHQICSWDEHRNKLVPILEMLAQNEHVTTILSLHPRARKPFYDKLAKKYGLAIAEEPLYKILPIGTLFMATLSTTVRWAAQLQIPSLVLRYGIKDTYLDHLHGNVMLDETNIADIYEHIERFIQDTLSYKRAQNSLAEATKDEVFDGKIRLRIVDDVVRRVEEQSESFATAEAVEVKEQSIAS